MRAFRKFVWLIAAISIVACGAEEEPSVASTLLGDVSAKPKFTLVASRDEGLWGPRDLGFHPEREGELWIVNKGDESVVIVFGATGEDRTYEKRRDPARVHFMSIVSSIAYGEKTYRDDYTFATCQESVNTYGGTAEPNYFMGPALWSSRLDVFAVQDLMGGGLGSHLDMLHHSPLCMGIAHETQNAYWVFDGYNGQIVRYDFQKDHGPGFDDHSDGIISFLDEPKVERIEGIPSHMEIDKENRQLYVADTGNSRVLRIDIDQREKLRSIPPKEHGTVVEEFTSVDWSEVISPGPIELPSGLALHDGILYVGDNATGRTHAIGLGGEHPFGEILATLDTGIPKGRLMGMEVGPDERLYLVDHAGAVLRLER